MLIKFIYSEIMTILLISGNLLSAQTLQREFDKAAALFDRKQYKEAHSQFQQFIAVFGEEPELQEEKTIKTVFPLMSYAAFLSGDNDATVALLDKFFQKPFKPDAASLFMRFLFAQANANTKDYASAAKNFSLFRQNTGNHVFAHIAALQEARMLFKTGNHTDATKRLNDLFSSSDNILIRMRARLLSLRIALDAKEMDQAKLLLLGTQWNIDTIPEIIALSLSALNIGEHFFKQGDYASAAASYRLATPPDLLLKLQEDRYIKLRYLFETRKSQAASTAGGMLWIQLYHDLLQDAQAQISILKSLNLSSDLIQLRLGEALLLDQQYPLADACFSLLVENPSYSSKTLEQAMFRWTVSAQMQGQWDNALDLATQFSSLFPQSEYLPEILALNARTFQEKKQRSIAHDIYHALLSAYPDHTDAPNWLYWRAMNLAQMNRFQEAENDFLAFIGKYSSHPLSSDASFWHALTLYFQKRYHEAISNFEKLLIEQKGRKLHPDILYRKATVHYALKQYETSINLISDFLNRFPQHRLTSEALILQGNAFSAIGKSETAKLIFSKVHISEPSLYAYAQFQIGKILKTEKDYIALQTHFLCYLDTAKSYNLPRQAEAVHWASLALAKQGKLQDALNICYGALEHTGNNPNFTEADLILSELQKLRKSYYGEQTADFELWITEYEKSAYVSEAFTLWARLKVFRSRLVRTHGSIAGSQVLLLELYDSGKQNHFDAQTLGCIALELNALRFEAASSLFKKLLVSFPESPYRSMAYFGLAEQSFQNGNLDDCALWLDRFESETPFSAQRFDANFLRAKWQHAKNRSEEAIASCNALLKEKSYKGERHARVLLFLANTHREMNQLPESIAYCQRVYTLYAAFEKERNAAYLLSSRCFIASGDRDSAIKSLQEFLQLPQKSDATVLKDEARALLKSLTTTTDA